MRKRLMIVAPLAALALLLTAAAGYAASSTQRQWVPDNELVQFRDVASQFTVAGADRRYVPVPDNAGILCISDPNGMGAMGVHYVDLINLFDGSLDAAQPEAIVYAPMPDGSLHLVALEYIVEKAKWDATHGSAPEFLAGHPFDETLTPNRFGLPAFYSQHIWVGRGNPLGNLNMWDPAVHCPS